MTEPKEHPSSSLIVAQSAVLSGLCKFVPVPLLDDFLITQVHRHMVLALLKLHGRPEKSIDHIKPVYGGEPGCLRAAVMFVITLPFKLVWKLIVKFLKYFLVILIIRDGAIQVGRTVMLGRAAERCLLDGRIASNVPERAAVASLRFSRSFRRAFRGSDWRLLATMFGGVLRNISKAGRLVAPVAGILRKNARNDDIDQDLEGLSAEKRTLLERLQAEVLDTMGSPEIEAYLKDFDERFDARWAEAAPAAPPPRPRRKS